MNKTRGESEKCRSNTSISNYITIKESIDIKGQHLGIIDRVESKEKGVVSISTTSGDNLELKVSIIIKNNNNHYNININRPIMQNV